MSTNVWNAADVDPAGGISASSLDDSIRQLRKDVRERLLQGGHKFATDSSRSSANENADGKHVVGIDDGTLANTGTFTLVWDFAGTTARIVHYGGSHASKPNRTEFIGDIGPLTATAIKFLGIAAASYTTVAVGDPLPIVGYLKRVLWKVPNSANYPQRTVKAFRVTTGTRPVGANLVVELRFRDASAGQTADNLDPFIDANTTLIAAATATLTAGGNYSILVSGLSQALDPDDELIIKYTSVGTTTNAADTTSLILME